MNKKLIGWLHPEGIFERIDVYMEISDKWCLSGMQCCSTDTGSSMECIFTKFADDTKMIGMVDTHEGPG